VSAEGIEPSTNGLKGHCSTIELRARRRNFITANSRRQLNLTFPMKHSYVKAYRGQGDAIPLPNRVYFPAECSLTGLIRELSSNTRRNEMLD
jgi:hypothetical protein